MKLTKKHILPLIGFAVLGATTQVSHASNIYVEVQGTDMEYEIDYSNGTETYELDPVILKLGFMSEPQEGVSGALEFHLIGDSEDDIIDPFSTPFRTAIDTSFGVHAKYGYQGDRFGFYGTLGLTLLDTTYTNLNTSVSNSDDALLLGGSLGLSFRIIENLRVTADYTLATGSASYPSFIGPDDPDVTFSGLAVGLNYQF